MALAPIAVFAFRRPDHLQRCLDSLAACAEAPESDLVVFCDGPRSADDSAAVVEVRRIAHAATGFRSVRVVESDANRGLAASLIDGVTTMMRDHDRVIVVEDDLVVSPDFLRYLDEALDLYADDDAVASIHAFAFATEHPLPPTYFLRGADCWGWATWRRGWELFDGDGAALLTRLRESGLADEFDLHGAYPYTAMLEDQVAGRIDSWAIRWRASAFLADKLTLWPGTSLVENIGQDGSGTHSVATDSLASARGRFPWPLDRVAVEESSDAREEIARALLRDRSTVRARVGGWVARWARR